jgi:hypothetical protein
MVDRGIHPSVGSPSGHVNGPARIAGVNRSVCTASLASLLSWDDDGQLAVD